jgi:hypothetical protein
MPNTGIAKLFRNGGSGCRASFAFGGSQVRAGCVAEGVLPEALIADPAHWFAELDGLRQGRFLGKSQEPRA